jgi:hypothetical protein
MWTRLRLPAYLMSRGDVMIDPGPLLVRDFASTILDIVPDAPCRDETFACSLRVLVDYMIPLSLALGVCVAVGFLLAISVSVYLARSERRGAPARIRKRVLSGPVRTDGRWIRLVEDDRGRRIEVLEGVNWRPVAREAGQVPIDVPVRTASS